MNRRITAVAAALFASVALAACSGGEEAAAPANDMVNEMDMVEEAPIENLAEPEPTPTPSATPTPVAAAPLPDEEQIIDDAESVGMTARVDRGEPVGNTVAPVQ
ncbi:hypothetical protein FPZ54_07820 [Sphingomonas suaedae]|uniref:Uncharacterized protein n=1 Tax=Sphingomonas suaedae TaxID=2599297 RepID=A0A518RES5_9SPHN|nr:hypothetical protein [Sphingomonas suaedae]QDX25938.1 hypothetical protein FPZ54_07820 [Sphingomonas suaedae]